MADAIKNVVFAGGGSRCVWQLGFWEGANAAGLDLNESVDFAASTSAGCAMATACMLGRGEDALKIFLALTAENPANIHWQNLKPGTNAPLLPHMRMYRQALEELLQPDDLERLTGKRMEFLMAVFPSYLPSALGTLIAFLIYGLEKRITGALHPRWTRKLGFRPLAYGNQEAESIAELIDTILASSCVPPVLPRGPFQGQRILDGGIIDNVPAHLADDRIGLTLVLLSKRYREAPASTGSRIYVQPSRQITIDKFDYASPDGLQRTYDLGLEDGCLFADQWLRSTTLAGA